MLPVESVESAIKFAFGTVEEERTIVFALGGNSYWNMLESGGRIRTCLSDSKLILLDDRARPGCGSIVDRLSVQGYVSLHDLPDHGFKCLEKVFNGGLYVSPCGETFLEVDKTVAALRSRDSFRNVPPVVFNDREWHCLRLLLLGGECEEVARCLAMKDRSARNMKYRLMKKMGVRHFTDLLRLAHQWGLLDF